MTLTGIAKVEEDQIGTGEGGGCFWAEEDLTRAGLYYQKIAGWFDYDNLYREIVEAAAEGSHFVEIGVFHGRSTCFLAEMIKQSGKNIVLDVVDTFSGNSAEALPGTGYYEIFLNHIRAAGLREFVNINQMTSTAASKLYQNFSLDFVFIDADHSYEAVSEDLSHWKIKVKPGGYLAGHDYDVTLLGVVGAVDEHFPNHQFYPPRCWVVPYHVIASQDHHVAANPGQIAASQESASSA